MNIPENILQAVADAAFEKTGVRCYMPETRRAVIQHAISNPALAPFLAGEALARAEKAEAELAGLLEAANEESRKDHVKYSQLANKLEGAQAELAALKSAELGILRLPAAEATPPTEPEPAAQVPLGPEDCPPGSVVRCDTDHWFQVLYASPIGVCINNVGLPVQYRWTELAERWQINSSIPDTGRWDANAWKPCSKPGK